jgi:type I restriction enzyme S subunit
MIRYKMSDVVDEISERVSDPSKSKYERFVGLEHYVTGEMEILNYGSTRSLESAMKVFHSGDVLVARRNVYLKRAAVVLFDGLTSGDSIVLRAKTKQMARLLPFILNTAAFWDFADKYSDGTMSKRLSPKTLLQYEFILPDEDEQEQLADLLWAIYDTRKAYNELLRQTDLLIRAKFIEEFGEPISNSKGLPIVKLSDLGEWKSGGTPSRKNPDYFTGDINWYSAGELNSLYLTGSIEKITPSAVNESATTIFSAGSLLIGMYDTAAFKMGILQEDSAANQACANIKPNDRINIEWLYYLLQIMKSHFLDMRRGCRQKNLNLGMIKNFEIPLAERTEQDRFVSFSRAAEKAKNELTQSIDSITLLIKRLAEQDFRTEEQK